jgi:hypothetical protein
MPAAAGIDIAINSNKNSLVGLTNNVISRLSCAWTRWSSIRLTGIGRIGRPAFQWSRAPRGASARVGMWESRLPTKSPICGRPKTQGVRRGRPLLERTIKGSTRQSVEEKGNARLNTALEELRNQIPRSSNSVRLIAAVSTSIRRLAAAVAMIAAVIAHRHQCGTIRP